MKPVDAVRHGDESDLRAEARSALDLVGSDPEAALDEADRIIAALPRQRTSEHREAASIAHRAAGLALCQAPDLVLAEARLRRAVREAATAQLDVVAAEATMSLAFVLLERGRGRAALRALDDAAPRLTGLPAARLRVQRALVLQKALGRVDDALAEYDDVIPELTQDPTWLARAHNNRSQLRAYRGDIALAMADKRRAIQLYDELAQTRLAVQSESDLAWLVGVSGRIAESLQLMDDVARRLPDFDPVAVLDRADILMRAGLPREAATTALQAATWLTERGWDGLTAEAMLLAAQASLRALDLDAALVHARAAGQMFRAHGRESWRVLADYVEQVALLRSGTRVPAQRTRGTLDDLQTRGWVSHALDLRLSAAISARAEGDDALARSLLGDPVESSRDLLEVRSRVRHIRAMGAVLDGDASRANRELARAWEFGERQRSFVGSSELRALVSGHAPGVVALGLELSSAHGRVSEVFRWAERGRAAHLRFSPARPPDDEALGEALGHLRLATYAEDQARLEGRADPVAARSRARSQREILRLTRQASGAEAVLRPVTLTELRDALGDHMFLEYVAVGPRMVAVVVEGHRARIVDVGPVSDVSAVVKALEFRLRRAATGFSSGSTGGGLDQAAAAAERLLVPPALHLDAGRPVVVSPTGPLWGVPWSLLASMRGRPVSVAPSATVWCETRSRPRVDDPRVLAVAGPRLAAAEREVRAVVAEHPNATLLLGSDATVDSVARLMSSSDIAHLAAHGTLNTDNPLFSTLELADGPLMGFDLEGLSPIAHTVLLPACRSGEGRAAAGDEMLGLAWALLAAGASSVVATLTSVADESTAHLMAEVHRRLARGESAAAALAGAQHGIPTDDSLAVATAAAFVVTGC